MRIQDIFQIAISLFVMFCLFPLIGILATILLSLPIIDIIFLKLTGIILMGVGLFVIFHCANVLFFKTGQDLPRPTRAPDQFIRTGLYKYTRNPMYMGDFVVIFSEFLIFGHILILFYLIIIIVFVNTMVIFKEEKELEKRFGEEYSNYKEEEPRWIPRFRTQKTPT